MERAEQHSLQEFMEGSQTLKREIGYNPSYFLEMVAEHGPAETSRRLIHSKEPSEGFGRLWEAGRLNMTVEALALLPWHEELFDEHDREVARHRLDTYEFDVDGFVASRIQTPPSWWHG